MRRESVRAGESIDWKNVMKTAIKVILIFVAVALAVAWGWTWWTGRAPRPVAFRTAPVTVGTLRATVSATGTLEPRDVVDVGAQVSGRIASFGMDAGGHEVDYDSPVNKGTVLARIDPSLYAADVVSARAALAQAQANVEAAKANLEKDRAQYIDARADWQRAKRLGRQSVALSASQYDAYKSTYDQARANVDVGKASVDQARMAARAAAAALAHARVTLGYCTITSPVKGVVIDRRVEIGQTVASSFNTPSLFLIAEDLNKIQVWLSVNEADIGRVHVGDPVTFTVDTFPNRVFHGVVSQVRLNATMVQNVVTYTVVVDTDNPGGKLLPYLTAQADIVVARRKHVMMVPTAALRWVPRTDEILPAVRAARSHGSTATGPAAGTQPLRDTGTVWTMADGYVRPLMVTVGLANNYQSEIIAKSLKPGMRVVVGERIRRAAGAAGGNPFIPQPFAHHHK